MSESFPPQENEREKNHVKSWTEANQAQDWFLKTFFSMPRPRRDGSTLTDFWLKCFITTMTLQFKEWIFFEIFEIVASCTDKNSFLMTFTYKADIEQHFDKNEKNPLGPKNS